jgi:hypothetical protein
MGSTAATEVEMTKTRTPRIGWRWLALLGVLAIGGAAGGVAWAAIPSKDGVIHACYARASGALRVIDAPRAKCKRSEKAIQWNVAGRPGPGAAYAEFRAGPGGAGSILLPEANSGFGIRILKLDVPEEWIDVDQHVVLVTVNFGNHAGQVPGRPLCAVLSDQGGYDSGDVVVPSPTAPGYIAEADLTFQAANPVGGSGASVVELWCRVGADHPPGKLDVRVEGASVTLLPRVG